MFYALKIDRLSTLKVGVLILLTVLLYQIFLKLKERGSFVKMNKKKFLLSILPLIFLMIFIINFSLNSPLVKLDVIIANLAWRKYLLNTGSSPMHWWTNHNFNFLPYFIVLTGLGYSLIKKRWQYLMFFLIFLFLIIFYIYFFDRYTRPRYLFYILQTL